MRVVIVGGGFGGVRTAIKLANQTGVTVTLISDQPYFEYHAAMYRAATGRSPLEVAIPLADFFDRAANIEVVEDKAERINASQMQVVGRSGARYQYDSLVLALGSVTQYFGIHGLAEFSYGIKSVHEALELKRHLHEELAEKPRGRTNYVVVGGGPTGVELAGELVSYLKRIRRKHRLASKPFKVILVEAAPQLLPMLPAAVSHRIAKRLKQLGVELRLNTVVEGETKDELDLPSGDIKTHSVIWTAGTVNNPLFKKHSSLFELDRGERVKVDRHLRAAPNIYVIGDSAMTKYTGMAQTALHDGAFVAKNLLRKLHDQNLLEYRPRPPIVAIPVGPRWTAVRWGKLNIYGYPGWLLRRLADLHLYLVFFPPLKALSIWRYGYKLEEVCLRCR